MNHEGDIDVYCARISYAGPREPTLAVLQGNRRWSYCRNPVRNLDATSQSGYSPPIFRRSTRSWCIISVAATASNTICCSMYCSRSVFTPEA